MYVEISFRIHGLMCVVVCNEMGFRCGYAGVKPNSILYQKSYDDTFTNDSWANVPGDTRVAFDRIEVHGGLTYSGFHHDVSNYLGERNPNRWWFFGFDCHHLGDGIDRQIIEEHYNRGLITSDQMRRYIQSGDSMPSGGIMTLDSCMRDCVHLADMLWAAEKIFTREVMGTNVYTEWEVMQLEQERQIQNMRLERERRQALQQALYKAT